MLGRLASSVLITSILHRLLSCWRRAARSANSTSGTRCAPAHRISYANICKLGFNHNYYTFTLLLLINVVLCGKFPWTKSISYKCFDMKLTCESQFAKLTYAVTTSEVQRLQMRSLPVDNVNEVHQHTFVHGLFATTYQAESS